MPATARCLSPLAKAIHLALVTPTIPRGVVELPTWYGEKLWRELAKGRGPLKYLKKVLRPNGKYRYFYHPAEEGGIGDLRHLVPGSHFRLGDSHFRITGYDKDTNLTVERISTAETHVVAPAKLRDQLVEEHAAALASHLGRLEALHGRRQAQEHAAWRAEGNDGPGIVTLKEARKLADSLGGGTYDPGLNLIVPKDPKRVAEQWAKSREAIAKRIGTLVRGVPQDVAEAWRNPDVATAAELYRRANEAKGDWISRVRAIAKNAGGTAMASMGPDDKHAVKALESLQDKVASAIEKNPDLTEAKVVAQISDALRASIIVERPEEIPNVVSAAMKALGTAHVSVDNKFVGDPGKPYIAVHADTFHDHPPIRAELQVHLRAIHDGTERSPQKQDHETYKVRPARDAAREAASRLVYLAAMRRVLNAPVQK